jgi:hypothetical protein
MDVAIGAGDRRHPYITSAFPTFMDIARNFAA